MKNNKMKNIIRLFTMAIFLIIIGCKEKPVEKEVIVVPSKTIIIEKTPPPPAKTTSITLDKNGVEVKAKEIEVKIKKD